MRELVQFWILCIRLMLVPKVMYFIDVYIKDNPKGAFLLVYCK